MSHSEGDAVPTSLKQDETMSTRKTIQLQEFWDICQIYQKTEQRALQPKPAGKTLFVYPCKQLPLRGVFFYHRGNFVNCHRAALKPETADRFVFLLISWRRKNNNVSRKTQARTRIKQLSVDTEAQQEGGRSSSLHFFLNKSINLLWNCKITWNNTQGIKVQCQKKKGFSYFTLMACVMTNRCIFKNVRPHIKLSLALKGILSPGSQEVQ